MPSHSIPVKLINLNVIIALQGAECAVLNNGPTSDCFTNGVKQDCVSMAGFLF